jgi:predicted negative regulator of RcsB-dependent stress response
VLLWILVLVLGAFGAAFSVANYPLFAVGVLVLALLLLGYAEWKRRSKQQARDAARMRDRASRRQV